MQHILAFSRAQKFFSVPTEKVIIPYRYSNFPKSLRVSHLIHSEGNHFCDRHFERRMWIIQLLSLLKSFRLYQHQIFRTCDVNHFCICNEFFTLCPAFVINGHKVDPITPPELIKSVGTVRTYRSTVVNFFYLMADDER